MRMERKLPRCVERTLGGKYRAKLARKGRPVKWTKVFDTPRQAASALEKLKREILDEEAGIAVRMTAEPGNLFALLRDYYSINEQRWAAGTRRMVLTHCTNIENHFKRPPSLHDRAAIKSVLSGYFTARLKQASPQTVNKEIITLNAAFKAGRENLHRIPYKLQLEKFPTQKPMIRVLSDNEIERILEHCNLFVRRFVIFMTLTGLRAGEAARLTFDDVDWERRQIRINQTKTGRGRAMPLPDEAVEILHLIRKGTNGEKNPERLVFPGKGGARQEHPHKRAVYAAFERAGIKGNGNLLHAFRHYYCSKLLESGASLTVAKNLMGHASLRMLDTYAHLFDGQKEQAVARLKRTDARLGQINPLPDTNRQGQSPPAVHSANRTPSPQPASRNARTGAGAHGATPESENTSQY